MSRVCVVTGATRGIGYAVAEALLAAGDTVAITGTSRDGVERAAGTLRAASAEERVIPFVCDVRDAAAVATMMADVVARCGGLDVLVNNAGVGIGTHVEQLSYDEWNRIIGVNLTGVFHCCKAAIPHLRRRGGGWIINVSSLSTKTPSAGSAAYVASKAALNAFSESLMQEVRHEGIRVSYVLPGSVATGFGGRDVSAGADWRLQPSDVAQAIVGLLAFPGRSLPSRVEIRPSRPQRS